MSENQTNCLSESKLELFKRHLEENRIGLQHHPYTALKGKEMAYKTFFLFMGIVFFALGGYLWNTNFSWSCHLLFGDCENLRLFTISLCCLLAATSLITGSRHHPSDEIAINIYKKAKNKLWKRYRCQRLTISSHNPKQLALARHHYKDDVEHLRETLHETQLILKRVRISKTLTEQEKESLYNETLFDLHQRLS